MLVCRDMTEVATDYLEDALPLARRLAVRWHLAICSFCRRHYRQLRQTVALLGDMPAQPPAQEIVTGVLRRIREISRNNGDIEPDVP